MRLKIIEKPCFILKGKSNADDVVYMTTVIFNGMPEFHKLKKTKFLTSNGITKSYCENEYELEPTDCMFLVG